MVVLGIDPGTANTGYGVVTRHEGRLVALDGGTIATAAGLDAGERLASIHARVGALLDDYRPDALAVEDLYFGANTRSAFAVGQARGVVILAAGQRGLPCSSYTPQQVKAAVCGSGRAGKGQVQRMVQLVLGMSELPRPDDAADALAIAIWACNTLRVGSTTAGDGSAAVLDRSAVGPITRGETGYERAVRKALADERNEKRSAS